MRKAIKPTLFFLANVLTFNSYAEAPKPSDYDNFRDCVMAGHYWKKDKEKCYPGRTWKNLPKKLYPLFDRPFTHSELKKIQKKSGVDILDLNKCQQQNPEAFVIFGAAASGKSSLLEDMISPESKVPDHFNIDKFTLLDGDIIRFAQEDYKKYTEQTKIGYFDLAEIIEPYKTSVKNLFLNVIIQNRCNVLVTSTLKGNETGIMEVDDLIQNGYSIHFIYVYVDYEESRLKAKNRAQKEGRWSSDTVHSKAEWRSQMEFAFQFFSENSSWVKFYNNSEDHPIVMSPDEFFRLMQNTFLF